MGKEFNTGVTIKLEFTSKEELSKQDTFDIFDKTRTAMDSISKSIDVLCVERDMLGEGGAITVFGDKPHEMLTEIMKVVVEYRW